MGELGGVEAFERIRETDAHVPVILSSGFSQEDCLGRFEGKGPSQFLKKPYDSAALQAALQAVRDG